MRVRYECAAEHRCRNTEVALGDGEVLKFFFVFFVAWTWKVEKGLSSYREGT